MPWHVGPQGGGTCGPSQWPVIKDSDGSTVGCHPSKKAAQAQVAALYANEPGAKMTLPDCTAAGELAESPAHFRASSVDNSAWDGPAAMSGCTHSGTPASCFSSICAGKKSGDTATQAAWALPHHKNPGGPPNAAGVSAALSRLPQTQGLTNAAAAKAHLQAHAHAINPDYEAAAGFGLQRGVAIRGGSVARMPNQGWRSQPFGGQMRAQTHTKSGIEYLHLEGYATVFDLEYDMWDMFGIYWESVDPGAFARSLASPGLDVAFLLNHRGMTMARTTGANPSLRLSADDHGLAVDADLRMTGRSDVVNLAAAIDEGLIDEMSFAFMLTAGEWDEDYMHFQITEADINRGDVSAVNYGANPYTSIASAGRRRSCGSWTCCPPARPARRCPGCPPAPTCAARPAMNRPVRNWPSGCPPTFRVWVSRRSSAAATGRSPAPIPMSTRRTAPRAPTCPTSTPTSTPGTGSTPTHTARPHPSPRRRSGPGR